MDNGDKGAIFPNKAKKSVEQPDFTGSIELSKELVGKLVRTVQGGGEAKIRIAGWKNQSKAGNGYVRLRVSEDTYQEGAPTQDNQRGQFRSEGRQSSNNGGYVNRAKPQVSGYAQEQPAQFNAPQGTPPWDMDL